MTTEAHRRAVRRYDRSEKGKATRRAYEASACGGKIVRTVKARYKKTAKGLVAEARYRKTDSFFQRRAEVIWRSNGINLMWSEYEVMFAACGGACSICGRLKDRLDVDHDHESGVIRGLICRRCNVALAAFGDNVAGLQKALRYLGGVPSLPR